MSTKKRYQVSGEYRVSFCVELEADSEAEAQANVKDDPSLALDSALSENFEIEECVEVDDD